VFKKHLIIGLIIGFITIVFSLLPLGELIELKGYDLFHILIKTQKPSGDIVIVAIDEPSFAETGMQWPWPRSIHAQLTDVLKDEGASVIGFDILFAEPADSEEDAVFGRSLRQAGNVCLASEVEIISRERYLQRILVEPIPVLKENSFTGIVNVFKDTDTVVRKFYAVEEPEILFAKQIARLHIKKEFEIHKNSYIAYVGPPDSFTTVSYYQALEPSRYLPKDFFKGKIVIIGLQMKTSPELRSSQSDIFNTPFLLAGKSLMSGVEIQANMVSNFLKDEFITRLHSAFALLLFLLLGILSSLLQIRWRPALHAFLSLLFVSLYLACSYALFRSYKIWIPSLIVVLPFSLSYIVHGTVMYIETENKRREIRKAFSHYLSPSILESVLSNPHKLKLGGEKVEATILFSDIAGFTSLSENLPPDDVAQFLNRYFDEMTKIVFHYKGTVDKFIGDGLMAFWGAPVPDPEHALNACSAAVKMQQRLVSLRQEMKTQDMPEISIRIGINTGMVIAGNMGSSELFNYTLIGDSVNLASRLESANKETGTSILISKAVYEKVAASVRVRPLGIIRVKGKSEEIQVYELLDINLSSLQS
jgi:adenylate cyclase